MKSLVKIFLCLGMAFCIILSACACDTAENTDTENDVSDTADTDTKNNAGGDITMYKDKTVTENYLPESVRSYYEGAFEQYKNTNFIKYCVVNDTTDHSLHAYQDIDTITNCVINKISIAVYKTGATDAQGMLTFSLFAHDKSIDGLKSKAVREYVIKIKPEEYGIKANSTVMKFIDIDVRDLGVLLFENETLAMFAPTDTIIPMRFTVAHPTEYQTKQNEVALPLVDNFPQAQSFYSKVGSSNMAYNASMFVLYDFEWDKIYTAEQQKATDDAVKEFDGLKTVLREKYSGKNVSILGDSISTFANIANNKDINSTIGDNLMYHTHTTNPHKWENTYWGLLVSDIDMKLCVNNSWASGRVYGRPNGKINSGETVPLNYRDSAPARATELHRNDGTAPDVILFLMGINDLHNNGSVKVPFGDLYDLLKNADESNYTAIIKTWFDNVLQKTANGSVLLSGNTPTYTSFEQAYALAIYNMNQRYDGVDVLCFSLKKTLSDACADETLAKYNLVIKALADYFGETFVDYDGEFSDITRENMHAYTMDTGCTHLNWRGHAATELLIMRTLAERDDKN